MTKTKIALIAALLMGTAAAAMAEDGFDPNLANRYPAYAASSTQAQAFRSTPVGLQEDRNVALPSWQNNVGTHDRASNPNAGGV